MIENCCIHKYHILDKATVGKRIRFYIVQDDGNYKFDFEGKLIKRLSENKEPFPFCMRCILNRKQLNVTREKWLVEYKDKFTTTNLVRTVYIVHSKALLHFKDEFDEEE